MMCPRFVGRLCLAIGICLLFFAIGTYRADAYCDGDMSCAGGGCVGSTAPGCAERSCTGGITPCWACQCQADPFDGVCHCTY